MEQGKRQKQVASVLQHELESIFHKLGLSMLDGGLVSISDVQVTPDLLEARIYLSLFQVKDPESIMKRIRDRAWEVKRELAEKIRNQFRRMPILQFYRDETLDRAFRMEELFKSIQPPSPEEPPVA